MPNLNAAQSVQPWRVTAYFVAPDGTQTDPGSYALLRSGVVPHPVVAAWARDGGAIELALGAPLIPGTPYSLGQTNSGAVVQFAYQPPAPGAPTGAVDADPGDPEAEVFGEDWDWLAPGLDGAGDVPAARGLQALRHDLAAVAFLAPGELVHRPRAGVGLRQRVNGSANDTALQEAQADTQTAFMADDRVRTADVEVVQAGASTLLRAQVLTVPLVGETIDFTVRV